MNNNSFSNTIGVNPTIIHNIIKGRNAPSYEVLSKIALSFDNISSDFLLKGIGDPFTNDKSGDTGKRKDPPPDCCNLCQEKDKVIAAMQAHLDTLQRELVYQKAINDEHAGHTHGQKRKVG
jgi:hypothetical protein